jgi:hypothetical protein
MKPLKYLESRIRGWLPKEPYKSSHQDSRLVEITQNGIISMRTLSVIAFSSLASSILLLFVPYIVSPQSYVPKADPSMGYASPKTFDAWIILAAALILLVFSILTLALLAVKMKKQGSIWVANLPWTNPRAMDDLEMKIFKIAMTANIVVVAGFLGTLALARGTSWEIESTATIVIIFNVLIFSVNLSLLQYYRKQVTKRRM